MKSVQLFLILLFTLYSSGLALAHESSSAYSSAISDPIKVHHAHIEDEQSINFSFDDDFQKEDGGSKRFAFETNLELAIAWNEELNLGSEISIPFSNRGNDDDRYGLGDIEFWPIKYAFLNEPERILTGVLSIGLPTGDEAHGFGEGQTKLGAFLLLDQSWRNWFFGVNAEFESVVSGPTETEVEFAVALSYSFIKETGHGMAPSQPRQSLIPILSLELTSENILSGLEKENDLVTILPSLRLWSPARDWQASLGIEVPLSSYKNNDLKIHLNLKNHFEWDSLLK